MVSLDPNELPVRDLRGGCVLAYTSERWVPVLEGFVFYPRLRAAVVSVTLGREMPQFRGLAVSCCRAYCSLLSNSQAGQ